MAETSGNDGFDHFVRTRFVREGDSVKILPDPLGGRYATGMTPEQAEFLARHLSALVLAARVERGRKYPGLFDADDGLCPHCGSKVCWVVVDGVETCRTTGKAVAAPAGGA